MKVARDIINRNRVWYCQECGKCSAVCPITPFETRRYSSPRLLVEKAMDGKAQDLFEDPLFWTCLTCKRCSRLCPSDVYFSEFVRDARVLARNGGRSGESTHGDVIQTWGRMMIDPDLNQNRLDWLTGDLKVSGDSDTLLFVGCLPYYDTLFEQLGFEGVTIAASAVKLLNHAGIAPQILADERCCGHDQIWEGDMDTFSALAGLNIEKFKRSGASRIVTACPECARTIGLDYPDRVEDHGMQVLHLTQLLAREATEIDLNWNLKQAERIATYQDPCRLGRHLGITDEPRTLIAGAGLQLVEMERNRKNSLCCGTSGWTGCGKVSKNIQVERLKEAKATRTDLLITACVKCQIHLKCAQADPELGKELDIEIRDLTTVLADRLEKPDPAKPEMKIED